MNRAAFLIGAALSLVPTAAWAQSLEDSISLPSPAQPISPGLREERLESPANESQGGLAKPSLSLIGSSDDGEVALTLGMNPKHVLENGGQAFGTVTFKAPLNKDKGEGAFLTEQGIPSKFGADASLTFILGASPSATGPDVGAIDQIYLNKCRADAEDDPELAELRSETKPEDFPQARYTFIRKHCATASSVWRRDPKLVATWLTEAERAKLTQALDRWRNSWITVINLAGGVGYKKFDYLNPVGFGELSAKRTSYYASASVGFSFSATSPFAGFGYQYRRDYEDADNRVICPASGGAQVECKNTAFDPPKRNIDNGAFALIRFANLFGDAKWGAKPIVEIKAAYDLKDDIFSVAVPVYFFLDDKKEYKGGIRVGWEEKGADPDKKQFQIGVFIVKSFDFMGL